MRQHESEPYEMSKSGATQSSVEERFDLVCPAGLRRLAKRYALGASKHSAFNYCAAQDDPTFQRARLNHLIRHVNDFLQNGNTQDDNLAAIAWAAFTLMHYEEHCEHHLAPLPDNALDSDPHFKK